MWVEGMLDGIYRRESLKVSSWEKAEQIRREMEEEKAIRQVRSVAIETRALIALKSTNGRSCAIASLLFWAFRDFSGSLA